MIISRGPLLHYEQLYLLQRRQHLKLPASLANIAPSLIKPASRFWLRNTPTVGLIDVSKMVGELGNDPTQAAQAILKFVADRGVRKRCDAIVLDDCNEGPFLRPAWARALHDGLNGRPDLGLPIIAINDNWGFDSSYRAWCCREREAPIIHTLWWSTNWVHVAMGARNIADTIGLDRHLARLSAEDARGHHFLCLNHRLREHRLLTLLALRDRGLIDKGLISFPPWSDSDHTNVKQVLKSYRVRYPRSASLLEEHLDDLRPSLPWTLDHKHDGHAGRLAMDVSPELYLRTWFSLVTETNLGGDAIVRVTEKTLKPMLNMHPFVLVGCPYSLANLRRMGFRTFGEFYDESYDEIVDPEARFLAVMKIVDELCALTMEQWSWLYARMRPVLEHNVRRVFALPDDLKLKAAPALMRDIRACIDQSS